MRVTDNADQPRSKPARPALTPLFICGFLFWAVCAAAYSASQALSFQTCIKAACAVAAIGVLAVIVLRTLSKTRLCVITASIVLGAMLGFGFAALCHASADALQDRPFQAVEAHIIGDSRATPSGEAAFASVRFEDGLTNVAYIQFNDDTPHLNGERHIVTGTFTAADWEKDGYLWQNGAVGRLRVESDSLESSSDPLSVLQSMRKRALESIGSNDEAHALLQALVCGYRHDVSQSGAYAHFQSCGLAHLVAVSGAHLVIVVSLIGSALKALRVPRRITIAVLVATMVGYLVIAGIPVSAVRATIMSSIGLLALFGRRRPSAMNALGMGVFAIVALNPSASVSASFALSALSTAGIVLFAPLITHWLESLHLARPSMLRDTLALTFSANLLSLPFACSLFHQLPLISPVANVVCAPLLPLSCGLGLICVLANIVVAPFNLAVIEPASACAGILAHVAGALSCVPYASVPISLDTMAALAISWLLAAALWALWPSFRLKNVTATALVLTLAFVVSYIPSFTEDAIVMLDVGQGDAFLIKSQGQTLLVDTGNNDALLLEQLGRCGVFKIGSVLITHSDDDHCGALDALDRAVFVDRVLVARGMLQSDQPKNISLVNQAKRTAQDVMELGYGDEFTVGKFTAHVVWPHRFTDGSNADSACLLVTFDGDSDGVKDFTALFTGDAESQELESMIKTNDFSHVDVLKVGHHGSKESLTENQAAIMQPRIALIGVGAHNRYGHPAAETLNILESIGCRIYRTDTNGQVKCLFTKDSVEVRLQ